MHILLVEPTYRSRYPPLGLLKLASYHRLRGDTVELVRGCVDVLRKPDLVYVTSLFTWAWKPVWDAVKYYKGVFPEVELWLGGIYASILTNHARKSGADHVHTGVFSDAENLMPAYDLVKEWDASILFSSRGCNRRCPYCAVWRMEGSINSCRRTIRPLIYPAHKRIILWDNNFFLSPYWRQILDELIDLGKPVDFNQGLDARLVTEEVAEKLSKTRFLCIRLSYDRSAIRNQVKQAIERISAHGIRRRSILIYILYNFEDDPEDFQQRVSDVLDWGAVVYPMRYEPLDALDRWKFVGKHWETLQLEAVEDFRRIYGYGGTFPPYHWLVERFRKASSFNEAFKLPRPGEHAKRVRKPYHASWHREMDWRRTSKLFLSKRW
jgi:hypothetical protein